MTMESLLIFDDGNGLVGSARSKRPVPICLSAWLVRSTEHWVCAMLPVDQVWDANGKNTAPAHRPATNMDLIMDLTMACRACCFMVGWTMRWGAAQSHTACSSAGCQIPVLMFSYVAWCRVRGLRDGGWWVFVRSLFLLDWVHSSDTTFLIPTLMHGTIGMQRWRSSKER